MSKATYEGFVEFVKSQPADKKINHASAKGSFEGGWNACAVGDYYRSIGEEFNNDDDADLLKEGNPMVYYNLRNDSRAKEFFPTYGDLAAEL